jgi:hypothetical protein
MSEKKPRSIAATSVGLLTLAAGVAAFLVPLQHPVPYGIPGRVKMRVSLAIASARVA